MPPFARPRELTVSQVKTEVPGRCPECGAEQLRRYPVNSEGGWFIVVKCQSCLHSVSREPWRLLGPLTLLAESIPSTGGSADVRG